MKKRQQLLAIAGLFVATIFVLSVAYMRHYAWEDDGAREDILVEVEIPEDTEVSETIEEHTYQFVESDVSYFEDALFIGDSRCVGIKEYGTLEGMTFFALEGLSIHNLWKKEIAVGELGELTLEELFSNQKYGKVYLMLGYNELGYDQEYSAKRYKETLDRIREWNPEAIIYICSNLHVTEKLSSSSDMFNNTNINAYNEKLRAFEDKDTFFYLEVNTPFDDENGNLPADYTSDEVHLYAKYYKQWCEWFCKNTIRK